MKPLTLLGAIVTALGLLALLMGTGIPYKGHKEVPSNSETHVTVPQDKMLSIPAAGAGAIVILGAGLMILGSRK